MNEWRIVGCRPREDDSDDESDSEVEFYYNEIDVNPNDFPELFPNQSPASPIASSKTHEPSDSNSSPQPPEVTWHQHEHQPLDFPSHQYQKVVVVGSVNDRHLSYNVGTATVQGVRCASGNAYVGFHASSAPTLSHMDMVRPPHENPELAGYQSPSPNGSTGSGPQMRY